MASLKDLKHLEEDLQTLRDYRLLDDDFMTIVFKENMKAIELLLRVILQGNGRRAVYHVQSDGRENQ